MNAPLPSLEEMEIAPSVLRDILSHNPSPLRLIDCREPDEFAICRIESATLSPLSRFADHADGLVSDATAEPLVIYCHHGMRSLQATRFLRQKGHGAVWSLAGGIDRWSIEIDPAVPRY